MAKLEVGGRNSKILLKNCLITNMLNKLCLPKLQIVF
nr:MAG TPA: hypothetical protein [Caudoviricetes sp.]